MNDWNERMATCLSDQHGVSKEELIGILEAAGELKCVRLKILLGRCLEILTDAHENDATPSFADGPESFFGQIRKEIQ